MEKSTLQHKHDTTNKAHTGPPLYNNSTYRCSRCAMVSMSFVGWKIACGQVETSDSSSPWWEGSTNRACRIKEKGGAKKGGKGLESELRVCVDE